MFSWFRSISLACMLVLLLGVGPLAHAQALGTASDATPGWQTYRSDVDGFDVSVPDDWVANAQSRSDGADVLSLTAADGTAGVTIVVRPTSVLPTGDDLPNTLCRPTTLAGLSATRCTDTLAFSSSTSVQVGERTYLIVAPERRLGSELYEAILASLSFDQAALSPQAAPPLAPDSTPIAPAADPPRYDCGLATGAARAKPLCAVP